MKTCNACYKRVSSVDFCCDACRKRYQRLREKGKVSAKTDVFVRQSGHIEPTRRKSATANDIRYDNSDIDYLDNG